MAPARKKKSFDIRKWELPSQNFLDSLRNAVDQLPNVPGFDRHSIFLSFVYCECFRGNIVKLNITEQKHLIRECMRLRDHYFPNLSSVDTADDLVLLNLIKKRVSERLYDQENSKIEMSFDEMAEHDIETGIHYERSRSNCFNADVRPPLLNPRDITLGDSILQTSCDEINGYLNGEEYVEDVGEIMDYLDAPLGAHEFDVIMDAVRDANDNENMATLPDPQATQQQPVVVETPRLFAPLRTNILPIAENIDSDAGSSGSSYENTNTPSPCVSDCSGSFTNVEIQKIQEQMSSKAPLSLDAEIPSPKRARLEPDEDKETPISIEEGAKTDETSSSTSTKTKAVRKSKKSVEKDKGVVKVEEPDEKPSPTGSTKSTAANIRAALENQIDVAVDDCFSMLSGEEPSEREKLAKSMGTEIEKRLKLPVDLIGCKFDLEEGRFAKRVLALFAIHDQYFSQNHIATRRCNPCDVDVDAESLAEHVMGKKHLRRMTVLSKVKKHANRLKMMFDCCEVKKKLVLDHIKDCASPPVSVFREKDFNLAFIKFAEVVKAYKKSMEVVDQDHGINKASDEAVEKTKE